MTAADDYVPIDCGLYDHLELVCLRRHSLRLHLTDGTTVDGKARTLRAKAGDGEYLELDGEDGARAFRLDRIGSLEVLDADAPFEKLTLHSTS